MSPMKRRRHFWGDPHRGSARIRPMGEGPLRSLRRANRLMETGSHAEAAGIFERLAYGARDIGLERRAPNLFLRGALAYHLAGDHLMGQKMLFEGLEMLAQGGHWRRLSLLGSRAVETLESAGFTDAARETREWLNRRLDGQSPAEIQETANRQPAKSGRLPVACPSCGAVVRPDEVEWIDTQTAECAYCGTPLGLI